MSVGTKNRRQAFCLHPFLHIYACYFLGVSEVSTAFLCALVCFDAERGIPPLAKAFPGLMKTIGVAFAVTFIKFRIVFWPYFCYYFWLDALELLRTNSYHNIGVVYSFMVVNVGLTLLQFYWLREIIATGYKVLAGDGELAVERGSSKKQN